MPGKDETAVVLTSGGIDSATCLGLAAQEYGTIIPVHFDYGQQTAELERQMAFAQIDHIDRNSPNVEFPETPVVNYEPVFRNFAEGVANPTKTFGHMNESDGRSSGYVPMRNLHLIATGAAFADTRGADAVYHGAQMGDEADYPDCRPEFMDRAAGAISKSVPDDQLIDLRTPLLHKSKVEVIRLGAQVGVDFSATWSCYASIEDPDDPEPCYDCPACEERIEAFAEAGVPDPYYHD